MSLCVADPGCSWDQVVRNTKSHRTTANPVLNSKSYIQYFILIPTRAELNRFTILILNELTPLQDLARVLQR